MTTLNCKYHPLIAARWSCPHCVVEMCHTCATKDLRRNQANCPLCKQALQQLEAHNFITPFWRRIPKFFTYPADTGVLLFLGLSTLGATFFSNVGILGLVMIAFIVLIYLRYAMAVLTNTADGNFKPVSVSVDLFNNGFLLPVKQLLILFGMVYCLWYFIKHGHKTGYYVAHTLFTFLLPAQVMLLATTGRLFTAINPLSHISLLKRIGLPYLLLFVFLGLISNCWQYATGILMRNEIVFWPFISNFLWAYSGLIMFNMMGYVIYQYHDELDYPVTRQLDSVERRESELSTADVLIKEGRLTDALSVLQQQIAQQPALLEPNKKIYEILKHTQDVPNLLVHADRYINVLVNQKQRALAADVLIDCLNQDSEFKISNPDIYKSLLSLLRFKGAYKQAASFGANFHVRYPQHADLSEIYFLLAQIFSEHLNNNKQAQAILEFLTVEFAAHPLQAQIRQYLQVMKNLQQGAA